MIRKIYWKIRYLMGLKNDSDYYSQGGEDAIVINSFSHLVPLYPGTFVDVGAYHPFKHSNTYVLYRYGWRGMNIDPRPGSKALFDKYRSKDINVEAGIADKDGSMTYYMLGNNSTMNTFSKENLERLNILDQVTSTVEVPVYTLNTLLAKHPSIKQVDYLNIDAEGMELEVLNGIDFSKTLPRIISIEQNDIMSLEDVLKTDVCHYLAGKGYIAYAKNVLLKNVSTVMYVHSSYL